MKIRHAALAALTVLVLTGSWTTNKSSGTAHEFHHVTATGAICGAGTVFGTGKTYLAISEIKAGAGTVSEFYIESEDLVSSPDTIPLGNGVAYTGNFPHGIDSLACITLDATAEYAAEVTN